MNRFLFPTDFSEVSRAALPAALQLALAFDAQLHIQHVAPKDSFSEEREKFPGFADYLDAIRTHVGELFDHLLLRRPTDDVDIVKVTSHHESPAQAILDYIDEAEIDLVVMSTHGHRGLRHLFIGSVAEEIVRRAPCPVMTVPGSTEFGQESTGRIVATIDLTPDSSRVLKLARDLATWAGAQLDIVHVVDLPSPSFPYQSLPEIPMADFQNVEIEVRERVEGLMEEIELDPSLAEIHVLEGDAVERIVEWLDERQPDLLVQGSHGREGAERARLGTVSEETVHRARCPVLTVRQQ